MLFLLPRYLNFSVAFLAVWKKQLDYKDETNFKIHDVTAWLTNNYNAHVQYLTF